MDTNVASPNASSSKRNTSILSGVLSAALAFGAVAWVVTAGIASAQTPQPAAETVSFADLDLSTEHGARTFLKRVDIVAQRLCGPEPVHSPLMPRTNAMFDLCVREAVDTAVSRAGEPLVLALHTETELSGSASLASR